MAIASYKGIVFEFKKIPEDKVLVNRFPRRMGGVFLIISAALAKWQIYNPLHAAENGKQSVWTWGVLVSLAIILFLYGFALIVFGKRTNEWVKFDPNNLNWKQAAFLIIFAIVGLAIYIWIDRSLAAQGYTTKYW